MFRVWHSNQFGLCGSSFSDTILRSFINSFLQLPVAYTAIECVLFRVDRLLAILSLSSMLISLLISLTSKFLMCFVNRFIACFIESPCGVSGERARIWINSTTLRICVLVFLCGLPMLHFEVP
jgi:hypothetical protein